MPDRVPPTSAATYERAYRLANTAMWVVDLQRRRLASEEPEDRIFITRRWVDFDFLIVALMRLRRAAVLAVSIPEVQMTMRAALNEFDEALPNLKIMRDVAEHIDEYAVDKGRQRTIARQWLEVSMLGDDGSTLEWRGGYLNTDEALYTARKLFQAIQRASSVFQQ